MDYKKTTKAAKKEVVICPSNCGSHKSMLSKEHVEFNELDNNLSICLDERGLYLTATSVLDNGLSDNSRVVDVQTRLQKLNSVLDTEA